MSFKTTAQGLSPRALWLPGEESGGTVTDESANSHDATNNGGAAAAGGPGLGLTSHMAFDGISDYLALTTLVGWDRLNATIGVWMRSTITASSKSLMGVFNDGSNTAFNIGHNDAFDGTADPGKIGVFARNDGSGLPDIQGATTNDTNLYDGDWHFLVFRFDLDAATPTVTVRIDKTGVAWTFNVQTQIASGFANFGYPLTLAARNLRGVVDRFAEMDVAGLVLFDTNISDADADLLYDSAIGSAPAIQAPVADATSDFPGSGVVSVQSFQAFLPDASSYADALAPSVSIVAGPTSTAVDAIPADSTSDALSPTVAGIEITSAAVTAIPADATADAPAPTVDVPTFSLVSLFATADGTIVGVVNENDQGGA